VHRRPNYFPTDPDALQRHSPPFSAPFFTSASTLLSAPISGAALLGGFDLTGSPLKLMPPLWFLFFSHEFFLYSLVTGGFLILNPC
jgi:hypothetical protein